MTFSISSTISLGSEHMANEDKLRDYLKRVTADLAQARERLRLMEERQQEPLAIAGIGCRFPGGAGSAAELWDLVAAGRDAGGGVPAGRGRGVSRGPGLGHRGRVQSRPGVPGDVVHPLGRLPG